LDVEKYSQKTFTVTPNSTLKISQSNASAPNDFVAGVRRERIGVLGGAFDPPHLAHLRLGEIAVEQLGLDRLIIIPTGNTPRKSHTLSIAEHRLSMARLTFKDLKQAQIDDCEILRSGTSYSFDTLNYLKNSYQNADFYLIVGADQANVFDSWYRWEEILQLATLAVADRQTAEQPSGLRSAEGLELNEYKWHNKALTQNIRDKQNLRLITGQSDIVVKLSMPSMQVSATHIRRLVKAGANISEFVTPAVLSYIQSHSLYN